ncbi:MAG: aminodeoxychorismate synthase component I [Myxococcota bacterium]
MIPKPRHTAHVAVPLPVPVDPAEALERLRGLRCPWLLESALENDDTGRFSFVGADPYAMLQHRDGENAWLCHRAVYPGLRTGRTRVPGPTLDALRSVLPSAPPDAPPYPFCGGAVGYFGYELAEQLDVHRVQTIDDLALPEAQWLFVDALVVFDHRQGTAEISALGFGDERDPAERRAREAAARLARQLEAPTSQRRAYAFGSSAGGRHSALDLSRYHKAFHEVGDAIAAGELYQACLTYRIDRPFHGDPWDFYRTLREGDPAPFAAYLELPGVTVAGNSPERFLRVDDEGRIESRPIKGTAPRGATPEEDTALGEGLLESEKDRAENVMIVDLVRNDLGRVCEVGSVRVPHLFSIEPYGSVFQMVSTVTGQLRMECDALHAVAAAFPPGSMTGAPKLAAMQLLDRLEDVRRGIYSGAIGYLDPRGHTDLSVVIRTAFFREGRAYLHTGGGLVADSSAEQEYAETRDKLRSLLAALYACDVETS